MMYRIALSILILFSAVSVLKAQRLEVAGGEPDRLAEEFINRLNALDDWYLTVDGKEQGVDILVDKMMELFAPDVVANVPPHDPEQIGQVMLRGKENVRKWVDRIARTQVRLEYIRTRQTAGEYEGVPLVYSTPLPWGGLGIAYQIVGAWSLREDRRRFMAPGSVFLEFGKDGKIQRLRLYLSEISEVVGT
jgi:hypothetical protein